MTAGVVAVLDEHYAHLEHLMAELVLRPGGPAYQSIFDAFCRGLVGLQRAIDHVLMPLLLHDGWKHMCFELLQTHSELKHHSDELLTIQVATPAHSATLCAVSTRLSRS